VDETPDQRRIRQWRQKAEECRTVGDQMSDPRARATLRQMADGYERLADIRERRPTHEEKPKAG
jgi:hypothetical protein